MRIRGVPCFRSDDRSRAVVKRFVGDSSSVEGEGIPPRAAKKDAFTITLPYRDIQSFVDSLARSIFSSRMRGGARIKMRHVKGRNREKENGRTENRRVRRRCALMAGASLTSRHEPSPLIVAESLVTRLYQKWRRHSAHYDTAGATRARSDEQRNE